MIADKDEIKRKKEGLFWLVILIMLILLVGVFVYFLNEENVALTNEVAERDSLIADMKRSNSSYELRLKAYADTISKYTDGCDYEIDGKTVTNSEIIKEYLKLIDEYNALVLVQNKYIDSLNAYKANFSRVYEDRATILKRLQELRKEYEDLYRKLEVEKAINKAVKDEYGINLKGEIQGVNDTIQTIVLTKINLPLSKADSALIIYEHYNRVLTYDSAQNAWNTMLIPLDDYLPKKKKNRKNK